MGWGGVGGGGKWVVLMGVDGGGGVGLCRSFFSLSYRFWLFSSFFSNNDRVGSQNSPSTVVLPLPLRSGTSIREDS